MQHKLYIWFLICNVWRESGIGVCECAVTLPPPTATVWTPIPTKRITRQSRVDILLPSNE